MTSSKYTVYCLEEVVHVVEADTAVEAGDKLLLTKAGVPVLEVDATQVVAVVKEHGTG